MEGARLRDIRESLAEGQVTQPGSLQRSNKGQSQIQANDILPHAALAAVFFNEFFTII